MTRPSPRRRDLEIGVVALLAGCVSVAAVVIYYRRGTILWFGDAVAHLNIARRVFDSRTPGPLQLGTVWLPLPHLLMLPFLLSDRLWRTGLGGSIPAMLAYVLGTMGIFRLVRGGLSYPAEPDFSARAAAWIAAAAYAANPNLMYMQSTAMTESLSLALFIWAVAHFSEFLRHKPGWGDAGAAAWVSLRKCAWCVAGAEFTRYDGWFLGAALSAILLWMLPKAGGRSPLRGMVQKFILMIAAVPALWLAYNAAVYRNPLEFANGPYSAKAIEAKTSTPAFPPHPGAGSPATAGLYFLKSGQINMAEGSLQRVWLALAVVATILTPLFARQFPGLWLLWVPLPFYVLSVAYGGVPIFMPEWWPFSYYNVRYGLQLLPVLAVGLGVIAFFLCGLAKNEMARTGVVFAASALMLVSYARVWQAQPVCYREAWVNSRTRLAFESELGRQLKDLPPDSSILMYLGDHVGALQGQGIALKRTINEGNHRPWRKPADTEGLWERALANPSQYVDYVVATQGDEVDRTGNLRSLVPLTQIEIQGQPRATLYRTNRR